MDFKLVSEYSPTGDQPEAIGQLVSALRDGCRHNTLLGVTGSGKTFTMANVIAALNKPTLIMSHNKTLAAQLYGEFKTSFRRMRSNISSLITTITSPRLTCRRRTLLSKRICRSTKGSRKCGSAPLRRC